MFWAVVAMTASMFGLCACFFTDASGLFVVGIMLVYYAGCGRPADAPGDEQCTCRFALGPGPLFYVISAEHFEDEVRERAMALANFFLWSFNLVTVPLIPLHNRIMCVCCL